MKRLKCAWAVLAACAVSLVFAERPVAQQQKFVTIGTGGVTGVYYAAGGASST
jgi:TRAP-type uncharacterized transport system substrate-binding protein